MSQGVSIRAAALGAALAVSAWAVFLVVGFSGSAAREEGAMGNEAHAPGPAPEHARPQLLRVFLHGEDIYPDVVRVRPGRLFVRAENQTGSEVILVVERERPGLAAVVVERIATPREARRRQRELTVGVGEYVFYEESRPEFRGRIIVEPF